MGPKAKPPPNPTGGKGPPPNPTGAGKKGPPPNPTGGGPPPNPTAPAKKPGAKKAAAKKAAAAGDAPKAAAAAPAGESFMVVLIGDKYPAKEKQSDNIRIRLPKDSPLQSMESEVAAALGVDSLAGLTFYKTKGKLAEAEPMKKAVDISKPLESEKTIVVLWVKGGDGPKAGGGEAKAPKKPAAKPGGPPPNPTGGPPPNPTGAAPPPNPTAPPPNPTAPGPPPNPTGPPASPPGAAAAAPPPAAEQCAAAAAGAAAAAQPPMQAALPQGPVHPGALQMYAPPHPQVGPAPHSPPPPGMAALPPGYGGWSYALPQFLAAPHSPPSLHQTPVPLGGSQQDDYRRKLRSFYAEHNPRKVAHVDAILQAYRGEEDVLFAKLKEKYEDGPLRELEAADREAVAGLSPVRPRPPAVVVRAEPTLFERQMKAEAQAAVRREEEKLREEVRARLDAALSELADIRRRESAEREDREMKERAERAERQLQLRSDDARHLSERRELEMLLRERAHSVQLREDAVQLRAEELRRREEALLAADEEHVRREVDDQAARDSEDRELREHARRLLALVDEAAPRSTPEAPPQPASPGSGREAGPMPPPPADAQLAGLRSENSELHARTRRLRARLDGLMAGSFGPRDFEDYGSAGEVSPVPRGGPLWESGGASLRPSSPCSGAGLAAEPPARPPPQPAEPAVVQLLERLGLSQYAHCFAGQDMDLDAFCCLSDQELRELGVCTVGARKRMQLEAERLAAAGAAAAGAGIAAAPPQHQAAPAPQQREGSPSGPPEPSYADTAAAQSRFDGIERRLDEIVRIQQTATPSVPAPAQLAPMPPLSIDTDPGLQFHKATLTDFYAAYDPVKVQLVDAILYEYVPRGLDKLYEALTDIYRLPPSPYTQKVKALCRRVAPEREAAAEVLCTLCRGREAELMEHLALGAAVGEDTDTDSRNWTELRDGDKVYYYSEVAREAQWERPAALAPGSARRGRAPLAADGHTRFVESQIASSLEQGAFECAGPRGLPPNPSPQQARIYGPRSSEILAGRRDHYRRWLVAFLLKHDDARLPQADALLQQFTGREDEMVEALRREYRTD